MCYDCVDIDCIIIVRSHKQLVHCNYSDKLIFLLDIKKVHKYFEVDDHILESILYGGGGGGTHTRHNQCHRGKNVMLKC